MIAPGTVAAIAASLMGRPEIESQPELWGSASYPSRENYIRDYVRLAWDIARETEAQEATSRGKLA